MGMGVNGMPLDVQAKTRREDRTLCPAQTLDNQYRLWLDRRGRSIKPYSSASDAFAHISSEEERKIAHLVGPRNFSFQGGRLCLHKRSHVLLLGILICFCRFGISTARC